VGSHNKPLTLSIVIPAYNEQSHLKICLNAIEKQTVMPDEVIVVDNNSTDSTVKIAEKYKFVSIVSEQKQGMAHARNKGFDIAKGEIIGRIDADASLASNWVEVAKGALTNKNIAAITGPGITSTTPLIKNRQFFPKIRTTFWSKMYLLMSSAILRVTVLWGSNMVIRKSVWDVIKEEVCNDDQIVHEDEDISIVLAGNGLQAKFVSNLKVETGGESFFFWPKFREYVLRGFSTKDYHKQKGTLINKKALLIPFWYSVIAIILGIIPSLVFIIVSYFYFIIPTKLNSIINSHKLD
jgi:glycosyltransferase involved in cell wall biosynthesis